MMEQHRGILYKVARAYCTSKTDREDLIQEMMIRIWHALPGYNSQYKLSTWLYRIALNVAISHYRKKPAIMHVPDHASEHATQFSDDTRIEREELLSKLDQFIHELKELDKALMLLYLEEKSHAEIADILGISVSNTGTRISRIKQLLREKFKALNFDTHE